MILKKYFLLFSSLFFGYGITAISQVDLLTKKAELKLQHRSSKRQKKKSNREKNPLRHIPRKKSYAKNF